MIQTKKKKKNTEIKGKRFFNSDLKKLGEILKHDDPIRYLKAMILDIKSYEEKGFRKRYLLYCRQNANLLISKGFKDVPKVPKIKDLQH